MNSYYPEHPYKRWIFSADKLVVAQNWADQPGQAGEEGNAVLMEGLAEERGWERLLRDPHVFGFLVSKGESVAAEVRWIEDPTGDGSVVDRARDALREWGRDNGPLDIAF